MRAVDRQEDRQIRDEIFRGPQGKIRDGVLSESSPAALVRGRRVDVSIAHDHGAALEGRCDELMRMGGPGGGIQQGFGAGIDHAVAHVQDEGTDILPDICASGLSGQDDLTVQPLADPVFENPRLSRLPGTVPAFEHNEGSGALGSHFGR